MIGWSQFDQHVAAYRLLSGLINNPGAITLGIFWSGSVANTVTKLQNWATFGPVTQSKIGVPWFKHKIAAPQCNFNGQNWILFRHLCSDFWGACPRFGYFFLLHTWQSYQNTTTIFPCVLIGHCRYGLCSQENVTISHYFTTFVSFAIMRFLGPQPDLKTAQSSPNYVTVTNTGNTQFLSWPII